MWWHIDPDYKPAPVEHKQVYGITFEQGRNELTINADTMLTNCGHREQGADRGAAKRDLIIALITLKYTQSNSCLLRRRTARPSAWVPVSRAASTAPVWRANKADNWQLRQHRTRC